MQRFKNILFVADRQTRGRAALNRAQRIAIENEAELSVVDVVEELPLATRLFVRSPGAEELQALLVQDRLAQLERLIRPLRAAGLAVRAEVLVGTAFVEIIRRVLREGHDLLIKAPQGEAHGTFGSTDLHLLRKCPCPVWLAKATGRRRYGRILAAVDPDPQDATRDAVNATVMELATSLAAREGSQLHVVHVWSLLGESAFRYGQARLPREEVDRLVQQTYETHRVALEELLARYPLGALDHRVHLMKGDARLLLPALASKHRAELLVMGTVARTGLPGLLIGNTAEEVLKQVSCSVLTVKPPGFETPVTP